MNVFRMAPPKWSAPGDIFNGAGAKQDGGRWNPTGVPCVYTGQDQQVSIAETGYYKGILPLIDFRQDQQILSHLKNLHGEEYRLCRLKIGINIRELIDISTPDLLEEATRKFERKLSFKEALKNAYILSPGTLKLANVIIDSEAPGLITQSARSSGKCFIFYPQNLPKNSCKIIDRHIVKLYFSSKNYKIWDGRDSSEISEDGMIAEIFHGKKSSKKFIPIRWGGLP